MEKRLQRLRPGEDLASYPLPICCVSHSSPELRSVTLSPWSNCPFPADLTGYHLEISRSAKWKVALRTTRNSLYCDAVYDTAYCLSVSSPTCVYLPEEPLAHRLASSEVSISNYSLRIRVTEHTATDRARPRNLRHIRMKKSYLCRRDDYSYRSLPVPFPHDCPSTTFAFT
jgi:hypothetical protein